MSLGCLTCQVLQRTDSSNERDHHYVKGKESKRFCCMQFDRSWSGNISPGPYEHIRSESMSVATKKMKKAGHHRRLKTIDTSFGAVGFDAAVDIDGEPKLVRSVGMRRDWSFEDLGKLGRDKNNNLRQEMRVR